MTQSSASITCRSGGICIGICIGIIAVIFGWCAGVCIGSLIFGFDMSILCVWICYVIFAGFIF